MEHNKKKDRLEAQTCLLLSAFLLLSLLSSCGGIVPPPPKKAGTAPQDKPLVESTIPSNTTTAKGVAFNNSVFVTFSKEMLSSSVNDATFFLTEGAVKVPGMVVLTGKTASFNPTADLKASTTFSVTVTPGVQDTFGNFLAQEMTWTFTTANPSDPGSVDTTTPFVVFRDPGIGENNVSVSASITVTFNEAIDPTTVTTNTPPDQTDTFDVSSAKAGQDIVPSNGNKTFTFIPDTKPKGNGLDFGKTHTVTITTGVKDLAGNPLAEDDIWTFTVEDPIGGG